MIAIVFVSVFFAYPALTEKTKITPRGVNQILRVWNIDTFEGGKGSRTAFLNGVARQYEKKNKECLIIVVSHTITSAKAAADSGEIPDIFSFGSGGAVLFEHFIPLEKYHFKTSTQNGKTLAVPWCRGGYFIFTLDGDFSDVTVDNTVISEGNFSLSKVATALENLNARTAEASVSAYVDLINGKYKYLIGTQRDVARLNVRGVSYQAKPLESFCDLYQYVSVLSNVHSKYNACLEYISLLLSKSTQKTLIKIGMMSVYFNIYDLSDVVLQTAENVKAKYSVSAFIDESGYVQMRTLAENCLKGDVDNIKKLKNFLI